MSITNSRSPSKPMSIESVMPSNHLILCHPLSSCPQSLPASGSFQTSQLLASGGQSIGVSPSTSVSTGQASTLVSWYHGDFLHTATISETSRHHPGFHPGIKSHPRTFLPYKAFFDYLLIHSYRDISEFLPPPSLQVHSHFKLFMSKI